MGHFGGSFFGGPPLGGHCGGSLFWGPPLGDFFCGASSGKGLFLDEAGSGWGTFLKGATRALFY